MAIVFNGTDQFIKETFGTGPLNLSTDFTLAAKFKGTLNLGNIGIIGAFNGGTANGALYFRRRDDLSGCVLQQYGSAESNTSPAFSLANDVWHSVVIVNKAGGTAELYINGDAVRNLSHGNFGDDSLEEVFLGASQPFGADLGPIHFFAGKCAYYRRSTTAISAANAAAYNSATSVAEVDAVLPDGANLISDATVSGTASALTAVGTPTYDADDPLASATPTITDINTNNQVTPGATATLTGTNLTNATGVNIGSVSQTGFSVVSDTSVTFTGTRGGNPYNQDLTATLLSPDGNATITVQQVPEAGTFAVTATSPNTTDDASLWSGLVDTATGDPVTVVDGDQAWVNTLLDGLAIAPDGTITANETGTFTVQFWRASEVVWGSDQTVSFTLPAEATDNWPFGKAINPIATKNWTWGSRHPMTGMRVRIFK